MYYDLIACSMNLLTYLKYLCVFILFIIKYYDRIVKPYHDPFEYNYALILFNLLFILTV
jgi:hypothetical protein